ncbi:MAG: rhomboid family intramembrane serine protease [Caldithrix sp.]|nr:MAG: rhomboid family intramembrane serine protease [Caldithrix sp.]TDJ03165.1 MAG: rhomboid family intramembrane serine protease [Caldithrix sp.]
MIPIKDDNPRLRPPIFTVGLIALNIVAFYFEIQFGLDTVVYQYGAIPSHIVELQSLETLLTSMFLHGGFLHLGGNMLYLWIFGDNIEGYLGHSRFLMFYLLCGLVAVFTHIFLSGISEIPMVGASGAVSGLLGAYLVKYPKARVLVVIPIVWFLTIRKIPAYIVLGFWFVMQLFYALSSLGISQGGGVAFWAHIGGFAAGIVLIYLFPAKKLKVSSN